MPELTAPLAASAAAVRPLPSAAPAPRCLVIACGALAKELAMIKAANGWGQMQIKCLPAELHNRPAQIPPRLAAMLAAERGRWERIFVAYADCGTAGAIDAVCEREGAARLPGADCYHFFAGDAYLDALEETPGTFFLTDFLARHFERIIVQGFKLDSAPDNIAALFGNYERLIYLSQTRDLELLQRAKQAAAFLGLRFEHRHTGLQGMAAPLLANRSPLEGELIQQGQSPQLNGWGVHAAGDLIAATA